MYYYSKDYETLVTEEHARRIYEYLCKEDWFHLTWKQFLKAYFD